MKFFFSAGEPSGDVHAAALIAQMKRVAPDTQCYGFGGPQMQKAGCALLVDLTDHAIMWVAQAVAKYFQFKGFLKEAEKFFDSEILDAVVLVDYPGFNWHVAKAAKKRGIPVYYFMPPQIWSWAQWRIKKMKANVDHILTPLPFEHRWFESHGCSATYIGHPFFESMREKVSDAGFVEMLYARYGDGPILTVLPGSRNQEVKANLDDMLIAVEYVRSAVPNVRPVIAAFNAIHAEYIQERLTQLALPVPVFVGKTTELIRAAECCLAVSGSVSLELLAANKPTVIYYRIGKWPMRIQQCFRRTRYITLVNLLAVDMFDMRSPHEKMSQVRQKRHSKLSPLFYEESVWPIPAEPSADDREKMLFPEFLTTNRKSKEAAAHLVYWLTSPEGLAAQKRRLAELFEAVDPMESPINKAAGVLLTPNR